MCPHVARCITHVARYVTHVARCVTHVARCVTHVARYVTQVVHYDCVHDVAQCICVTHGYNVSFVKSDHFKAFKLTQKGF